MAFPLKLDTSLAAIARPLRQEWTQVSKIRQSTNKTRSLQEIESGARQQVRKKEKLMAKIPKWREGEANVKKLNWSQKRSRYYAMYIILRLDDLLLWVFAVKREYFASGGSLARTTLSHSASQEKKSREKRENKAKWKRSWERGEVEGIQHCYAMSLRANTHKNHTIRRNAWITGL